MTGLILKISIKSLDIKCDVSCRFALYILCKVKKSVSLFQIWGSFYHEWTLKSVKYFFALINMII